MTQHNLEINKLKNKIVTWLDDYYEQLGKKPLQLPQYTFNKIKFLTDFIFKIAS